MSRFGVSKEGTPRPEAVTYALQSLQNFMRSQVLGSAVLVTCAIIAFIWANLPGIGESYFTFWETPLIVTLGEGTFSLSLHGWINEGLMMFFFLLVGLEIKEQVLVGELSSIKQAALPVGAALGGMIAPALIYVLMNSGQGSINGWGIPMATDIAFALGVLSLLGDHVPLSLKVFLAALAIADDIGAIAVIALFYTDTIVVGGLLFALIFWLIILVLSRLGIYSPFIYFMLTIGVWIGFTISGVHATLGGVLVATIIPARSLVDPGRFLTMLKDVSRNLRKILLKDTSTGMETISLQDKHLDIVIQELDVTQQKLTDIRDTIGENVLSVRDQREIVQLIEDVVERLEEPEEFGLSRRSVLSDHELRETVVMLESTVRDMESPLVEMENSLQPWVTFVIMPLFALSNAGVQIGGNFHETLLSPASLGVILGLLVGKQVGITFASWLMVRAGIAELPQGLTWRHIHGVSVLAGIGFTVSLFITELAFVDHHFIDSAKVGILFVSILTGILGYIICRRFPEVIVPELEAT